MVRAAARNKVMIYSYRERLARPSLVPWNPDLFTLGAAQARTSRCVGGEAAPPWFSSPRSTYDPVCLPRRPCDART
jgi:hypothetical protein